MGGVGKICHCELRDIGRGNRRSSCKSCRLTWNRFLANICFLIIPASIFLLSHQVGVKREGVMAYVQDISFVVSMISLILGRGLCDPQNYSCEKAKYAQSQNEKKKCFYCYKEVGRKNRKAFYTFFGCRSMAKSYSKKK